MSGEMKLEPGMKGSAETRVEGGNTALAMGSGEIEVFATPAMVALMEAAAVHCVKPALAEGETSVGVRLEISHIAATPVGMAARAEAVLEQVDGRRLVFQVSAYDAKDKIGDGRHERVVVQKERFMSKVNGKK